jgi:adenylate cyclase
LRDAGLRNASRLLYLINELLELARFDSGKLSSNRRSVDLADIIRSVAANFESGRARRIHLSGVAKPVVVNADVGQLKKVIYNLLSNARKFSDETGGQVWIRVRQTDTTAIVDVEDNGIGINAEDLDRIFDRFTQVEGSRTRRYEGTGIGLALVKEIVLQHGGAVTVDSRPGAGSTFTVSWPLSGDTGAAVQNVDDDSLPEAEMGRALQRLALVVAPVPVR